MKRVWLALLAVALSGSLAAGQGGFISGVIRDRSGAAVAGAEVRVESEQTGARQKALANSAPTTGLAPRYQAGGPRTIGLGLGFTF